MFPVGSQKLTQERNLFHTLCINFFKDLLHHEINSLRQIYDQSNIKPIASASEQIPPGSTYETLLGIVKVLNINARINDMADNGTIQAKFCKKDQTSWSTVCLELTV